VIPLSDIDRRPLRFPVVTASVIGMNIMVFFLELIKGEPFIIRWAFIPSEISAGKHIITIFTAMFIHGGLLHIVGNMVYLWAFGPEIEEALGRVRYIIFYLLGGMVASIAQVMISPDSMVPSLGASGAIAAVMGAFLIAFPHDRIRTVIFLGWFVTISLIPSIFLVGFWFLIQFFSEVGTLVQKKTGGGIAYMAHIGGFVFGMAFIRLFRFRYKYDK
jgi:membrane associated rhomboid family serine protease